MTDPDAYAKFIATKSVRPKPEGIKPPKTLPAALKPFQRDIVKWALAQGRCAIFAGTGLGKSLMQLSWADAVRNHTKKNVLILTPLAVAHQTVKEAKKFGIASVEYASDNGDIKSSIVVTNYDRVEKFDMGQFSAVVCDESGILKAHTSQTRALLTELCADVPYRLCCTATPSPNDTTELGNHSEFLGILSSKEMLATWFVHEGSIRATSMHNHGSKPIAEWRLKFHAQRAFWQWLSTWAVVIRHPRDIGYEDAGYDLPPLHKHQIIVPVPYEPNIDNGMLFPVEANTLQEQRQASRASIDSRVSAAAALVNSDPGHSWLIWCQLNDEADAIRKSIPTAIEVRGDDDRDLKTERLLGFADGQFKHLVSKPKIAGFGMNFQVCSRMIFVGLNNSFEQTYQSIRRCWRFGQTEPVHIYMIASETEGAVVANLDAKELAADNMQNQMAEHMKDLTKRSLKGRDVRAIADHKRVMEIPQWLT